MRSEIRDGRLAIFPEGRIDSVNAADFEKELMDLTAQQKDEPVLDGRDLEYISSAGLRVLMKLRRLYEKRLDIVNISGEVYDILEVTGFTELFNVKKAYRKLDVEGLELIGKGFFGKVYRVDPETIVKVYRGKDSIPMIENEKKMAQKAFISGLPTAISYDIVQVGEDYGSVFELLDARTFHELVQKGEMPLEEIMERYIAMLRLVHSTRPDPGTFPSCRQRFLDYLEKLKEVLTESQYSGLRSLLLDMEEEDSIVHGDIQMKNVMLAPEGPMLIDMDTLGQGNPVFDMAGLFVTYQEFEEDEPGNSMDFLGMTQEMVDDIWKRIIDSYFDNVSDEQRQRIVDRIRLVAAIRFLYLIVTTDLKDSELGRKRIEHTREHIEELLKTTDSLGV